MWSLKPHNKAGKEVEANSSMGKYVKNVVQDFLENSGKIEFIRDEFVLTQDLNIEVSNSTFGPDSQLFSNYIFAKLVDEAGGEMGSFCRMIRGRSVVIGLQWKNKI